MTIQLMTIASDDPVLSIEQQGADTSVLIEVVPSAEPDTTTSNGFVPPPLLYLTLTLLPEDQHPDGRPILPGIHSPDEIAHFFPILRETQLSEVRSHLPNWISEYEQVLAQCQMERTKAEAAKPKSLPAKSRSALVNERPPHVEVSSKPNSTKEVRGKQRSLFDVSS
jgi:hypothetical protein